MKKRLSIVLAALFALSLIVVGLPALNFARLDAKIKRERDQVHQLIAVGQNIFEAEEVLRENGYSLFHEKPVHPTLHEDYLWQLVIIGDTSGTEIDRILYAVDMNNPFRYESPYVEIKATNDGVITLIN